jgi:hypothetical protein
MPGHRHPVARCPDVDPRRVGKYHLFISLAHRHRLLQDRQRTAALLGRRLFRWATAFSLLIDQPVTSITRWGNVVAPERGQGRVAFFAARRSVPLTPWRGQYARKWLWARHLGAYSLRAKASLCKKRDCAMR